VSEKELSTLSTNLQSCAVEAPTKSLGRCLSVDVQKQIAIDHANSSEARVNVVEAPPYGLPGADLGDEAGMPFGEVPGDAPAGLAGKSRRASISRSSMHGVACASHQRQQRKDENGLTEGHALITTVRM
jgi:hypothetical protein